MKDFLSTLGFLLMVILVTGYLYKSGYRLERPPAAGSDLLQAAVPSDGEAADQLALDPRGDHDSRRRPSASAEGSTAWAEVPSGRTDTHRESEPISRSAAITLERDIQAWIGRTSSAAVLEATRQGVPAGVSLSLGAALLEAGKINERSDFVREVVDPLARLKEKSPESVRNLLKYSANSGKWFEGLDRLGHYRELNLEQWFKRYDLAGYDAETYLALQHNEDREQHERGQVHEASMGSGLLSSPAAKSQEPSRARQEVADDNLRPNMAYAMNRLSERRLDEKDKAMRFKADPNQNVGAARHIAESMRVGEKRRFNDPAAFHAVLREVLAIEAGYASWDAYKAADERTAKRAFARRSDPLISGGKLEVRREK